MKINESGTSFSNKINGPKYETRLSILFLIEEDLSFEPFIFKAIIPIRSQWKLLKKQILILNTIQKFEVGKFMFLKGCIYLMKNKSKTVIQ